MVFETGQNNLPRSFEIYGFGRESFASHSFTIRFHCRTVLGGNVSVISLATLRCFDAMSTALMRFVSSSWPIRNSQNGMKG